MSAARRGNLGLLATALVVAGLACDRLPTDRPASGASASVEAEKGWAVVVDDSVEFEGRGLSEVYALAVGPDGRFAAVDRADGDVHLFSPDGELRTVLGDGREMSEPMDVTFTPDGRIVVATLDRPHVRIYAAEGTRIGGFELPGMLFALRVASVGDGRIVVVNHRRDPLEERLGLYDLDGTLVTRFHPSRAAYYEVPYWESTTRRLLATDGGRIAAGGNLAYPFELYDASGDRRGTVGSPPPRWQGPPKPPEGAFTGTTARREFEEWRRTFSTIHSIAFTADSAFAVVTEELDPEVLSYDRGSYTLDLYRGDDLLLRGESLPGPLLEGGERLWVLGGLEDGRWRVLAYRVTGPGGS